jgi:acetyl esterase/lipase
MLAVLTERQAMHATDLSGLSAADARDVPNLIAAARAIPNVNGLPATFTGVPTVTQLVASGAETPLGARLYAPALANNTPIIIYFVGGTWVTGNLDTYEETARQLAARTGYIVVSVRTRRAPEAEFPAAHDDAFAAYQWARGHMREWGADPTRVVLAGEGPGANLAISTALLARDRGAAGSPTPIPDQLLLITPVAGTALSTQSMSENRSSQPLTRATVDWAQWQYARHHLDDPRIDVAARTDFAGLPPTTIILAEIDPLRSGGEELAAKLQAAGVKTNVRTFPGTTYDFFSLATQVPEAAEAEAYAANTLTAAFYQPPPPPPPAPVRPARRTRPRR